MAINDQIAQGFNIRPLAAFMVGRDRRDAKIRQGEQDKLAQSNFQQAQGVREQNANTQERAVTATQDRADNQARAQQIAAQREQRITKPRRYPRREAEILTEKY